jgi:hypothetical protein
VGRRPLSVLDTIFGIGDRAARTLQSAAKGRPAMLSQETLEQYRRMTVGERLDLTFDMIRDNTPYLLQGSEDVVARRFELIERENDLRNERILAALSRLQKSIPREVE